MADKWKMHSVTEAAIVRLEGQSKDGELQEYGTPEHLAVIRYGVEACATEKPKTVKIKFEGKEVEHTVAVIDLTLVKEWFRDEAAFLGYASNAKKMLAGVDDGKAYPKLASKEKVTRGYE